ncbi:hypothetical protein ES703_57303 [subsurface metagenome]
MIVDSDVLIWYMRGNEKARSVVNSLGEFSISSMTYMEILQGLRNKEELRILRQFMRKHHIRSIPINPEITARAIFFLEEYSLSHGMRIGDAVIAATVAIYGEMLFTANSSHYKMIPNFVFKTFYPA